MNALRLNSRREFIKSAAGFGALLALGSSPLSMLAAEDAVRITILHTNDWHSRIDPFPMDGSKFQGMGGAAARAHIIKEIRKRERNVLLLDAGDIFQGTPYFNFYGGELEFKLMSAMGYDAGTLGNHDFDNGLEGLHRQLPHAAFPFLIANYDFSDTLLEGKFSPYKIFVKDKVKIGVFGLGIELKGLVPDKLYGATRYLDPVQTAKEVVKVLKFEEKCDLVICLSHLGYQYKSDKISDEILASRTSNIDLIIGGHTHTFLNTPVAYKNAEGKQVFINQVGWAGINLGSVGFILEKRSGKKWVEGNTVMIDQKSIEN
jgi:5'-nucleotidase